MRGTFIHTHLDVMRFLERFRAHHGVMPTVREIQDGMGMTSTSVVVAHLHHLEQEGYITRPRYKHRGIQFTKRLLQ